MGVSLKNFEKLQFSGKVLLLGDMRELGADSVAEHVNILKQACAMDVEEIYLVGAEFAKAADVLLAGAAPSADVAAVATAAASAPSSAAVSAHPGDSGSPAAGAAISLFRDAQELAGRLKAEPLKGRTILIKGSHGIHLETLVELL